MQRWPIRLLTGITLACVPLTLPAMETAAKPREQARPLSDLTPRSRDIPELSCRSSAGVTVTLSTMEAIPLTGSMTFRLKGNLLYTGLRAGEERPWGTVNRTDRRRWSAGTATLLLSEDLSSGSWVRVETGQTIIRKLTCEPATP